MKGKILLVTGLAVGYVLGAKAGRERYETIKRVTDKFWHSKGVQKQVSKAEGFVKDKTPEVIDFVADGVKKVTTKGTKKPAVARPAPRTTATTRSTATGN